MHYVPGDCPIILTAPHGGSKLPDSVADRTSGCFEPDWGTEELTRRMQHLFSEQTPPVRPHVVIALLHRRKVDFNRPKAKATECDAGRQAWAEYHGHVADAVRESVAKFGFCQIFDVHGQGHRDVTELGYGLNNNQLKLRGAQLDACLKSCSVTCVCVSGAAAAAGAAPSAANGTAPEAAAAAATGTDPGAVPDAMCAAKSLKRTRSGSQVDSCCCAEDCACACTPNTPRLEELLRGPQSLGFFLERAGHGCVPSPSHPHPCCHTCEGPPSCCVSEAGALTVGLLDTHPCLYFWGGFTTAYYGVCQKMGDNVAVIQMELSPAGRDTSEGIAALALTLSQCIQEYMAVKLSCICGVDCCSSGRRVDWCP